MAPSAAKFAIDRKLLLCAAGRSPSDVAFMLMRQTTQDSSKSKGDAALSITWSLPNQANIRGKWNVC